MKFRRKSEPEAAAEAAEDEPATSAAVEGPHDADDLPDDGIERVDLGSLLIPAAEGRELRLQVDEASGQVRSVMLAGPDGGVEIRAFAAPRNGDLWDDVRPQIAADMAQRGGTATEREGRFGPELICEIQIKRPEGTVVQNSRIIGINGGRWMLRATFLGRPARDVDSSSDWEDLLTQVGVRRGTGPMMSGEILPITLPENARPVTPPGGTRPPA
ncbi:DUF3710 domain-containing protein [Nocardioides sp. GXZ039]|uniref:DUF3710 domain-containing protein n=1 Tax=Nocardioides sp. GXZ039 TaxID=3136018 RepID=UPI0030F3CCCB